MFVEKTEDIYDSVINFQNATVQQCRKLVSSFPKYFVHIEDDVHYFGLSKFCAWKQVTVDMYLDEGRYNSNGNKTQKLISKVLGKEWIPYRKVNSEIAAAFEKWIHSFYPNYNLDNANFITVTLNPLESNKRAKLITPEMLSDALKRQKLIGEIGEEIAYEYELNRLREVGAQFPENHVIHEAKLNVSSGYDICTKYEDDERYIEVKSTIKINPDIYLTENEINVLSELGNKAYLYLVRIIDKDKKKGDVEIIQNPIKELKDQLIPIAYKVVIREEKN